MNGSAALFLVSGWGAIRRQNKNAHGFLMGAALAASTLFLFSYLTYHFSGKGLTRYQGKGLSRFVYCVILFTHIPLAMAVPPFALLAVYHAIRKNFLLHTRITRWLLPVWLYVSVTGVLIYWMLYR